MRKSSFRLRATATLALSLSTSASAASVDQPFIALGSEVGAPRGFVEMCRTDATFCTPGEVAARGDRRLITASLADVVRRRVGASATSFDSDLDARVGSTSDKLKPSGERDTGAVPTLVGGALLLPLRTDFDQRTIALDWGRRRPELGATSFVYLPWSLSMEQADEAEQRGPVRALTAAMRSSDGAASIVILQRINRFVNERVAQRTDMQVYGRDEVWHRSGVGRGAAGDCEDIAIEKRSELLDAGVPANKMYFAVVYERAVGLHAVLIARSDDGDYVLDSRSPYVSRWDRTAYSFVAIQSPDQPMRWFARGAASMEMAAVEKASDAS